ncbi:MAG: glycerol-3-phosphate acyltransferase [Cereibacter sphaeroides]|uniref:Glycerol-3-phosphate acyltransferase n=1 Tax=Cereibacter sphaeroides TaxID=1063 RepID=A0A2W5S4N2_CERSP|nr:MAG: glycerol-3-phosphate acyltransferase [Cereibacter sphaeroides]
MPIFDSPVLLFFLVAAFSYLLGSIPFGLLITRVMGLGDPRKIGSGNIGATNVLRTGNRWAALATLLCDAGKGALAVLMARKGMGEDAAQVAALAVFLGHLYPIWIGFKGGKGVATFLGVLLALSPIVGLAACATWAVTALVGRYSSLSALMAAVLSPVWVLVLGRGQMLVLVIILAALVVWRHAANIARLRAGTEPKIGAR